MISRIVKRKTIIRKTLPVQGDREDFFLWLESIDHKEVEMIFHIGARTDTTEFNMAVLENST